MAQKMAQGIRTLQRTHIPISVPMMGPHSCPKSPFPEIAVIYSNVME